MERDRLVAVFAEDRYRYTNVFGNERKAATGRSTPKAPPINSRM